MGGLAVRKRSTWAVTTSSADTSPALTALAVSTADHCQMGVDSMCFPARGAIGPHAKAGANGFNAQRSRPAGSLVGLRLLRIGRRACPRAGAQPFAVDPRIAPHADTVFPDGLATPLTGWVEGGGGETEAEREALP